MVISSKLRKPKENPEVFRQRRQKIADKILKQYGVYSALIVGANPERIRNDDVHYPYRQDSNMYYLTGFEEPESILVIRPNQKPQAIMFVRNKNIERETWDGFRFGPEGAQEEFLVDQVYSIDEFDVKIIEILKGTENILYKQFKYECLDKKINRALQRFERTYSRSGYGVPAIHDADIFLGECRIIKDIYEIQNQRRACEITALGHIEAMKSTHHGVTEATLQGVLTYNFLKNGSAREGYSYIVASGNNATTLHYNFNDQVCADGDLVLIDAGAEYNYYSGDITRTYPVSGKFTDIQKKIYQAVLDVQKDIIAMIKPDLTFKTLQEFTVDRLVELMLEFSLVRGRKEDIIQSLEYKKYYPHGVSHWLGLDVHDAGLYVYRGESRKLEPGMVFTVEPGIYIPENDTTAPKELRGIGIRIEDNILVTENGYENLTVLAPKEIEDIEKLMLK